MCSGRLLPPQPFPSKLSPVSGTICSTELLCSEAQQPAVGFWEPMMRPGSVQGARQVGHDAKQSNWVACHTSRNFSLIFLCCQILPWGEGGLQAPRRSQCPACSLGRDCYAKQGKEARKANSQEEQESHQAVPLRETPLPEVMAWNQRGGGAAPVSPLVLLGRALPSVE